MKRKYHSKTIHHKWDETNQSRSGRLFKRGGVGITVTDFISSPLSGKKGYRKKKGSSFFGYSFIDELYREFRKNFPSGYSQYRDEK